MYQTCSLAPVVVPCSLRRSSLLELSCEELVSSRAGKMVFTFVQRTPSLQLKLPQWPTVYDLRKNLDVKRIRRRPPIVQIEQLINFGVENLAPKTEAWLYCDDFIFITVSAQFDQQAQEMYVSSHMIVVDGDRLVRRRSNERCRSRRRSRRRRAERTRSRSRDAFKNRQISRKDREGQMQVRQRYNRLSNVFDPLETEITSLTQHFSVHKTFVTEDTSYVGTLRVRSGIRLQPGFNRTAWHVFQQS